MDPYEMIWIDNGATTIRILTMTQWLPEIPGHIHRGALGSVKTVGPATGKLSEIWEMARMPIDYSDYSVL